ncbi:hypothetical protein ACFQHO_49855 [Actinomadura yumaensis]|uniref:hypothetical protein n=1 Tax=Actinomadura yumaensis TaxID=111807 RepID=UPI003610EA9B
MQLDGLGGAAGERLRRRVVPQRLLDPVVHAPGERLGARLRVPPGGVPGVAEQQHGRLDARADEQDQHPDDLLGGEPVVALGRVQQPGQQVVAALSGPFDGQLGVVADEPADRLQRLGRQVAGLLVPVHDRHAEVADQLPVPLRDADQLGDHVGREARREVAHQVERPGLQQRPQVPARDLPEPGLQRLDALAGERPRHQPAHPRVLRRVHRHEREEPLRVRAPERRFDAQSVHRGEPRRILQC